LLTKSGLQVFESVACGFESPLFIENRKNLDQDGLDNKNELEAFHCTIPCSNLLDSSLVVDDKRERLNL
jgi:hypothetical protein